MNAKTRAMEPAQACWTAMENETWNVGENSERSLAQMILLNH